MEQLKQKYNGRERIISSDVMPERTSRSSTFNLSKELKTTINFDKLYPVYWEELNPGDEFEITPNVFTRLAPTVAPIMDDVKLELHAFWVPNRLLWQHWINFMGEKQYQTDKTTYLLPRAKLGLNKSGSLGDYLGLPLTEFDSSEYVSLLPFRAYRKIYNDFIRAIQLEEPLKEYSDDNYDYVKQEFGKESIQEYEILSIGKDPDYFTSCLPTPNNVDVEIGITGNAPVLTSEEPTVLNTLEKGQVRFGKVVGANPIGLDPTEVSKGGNDTKLYADMSKVTGVSIEALRYANALQVAYEYEHRYGERYGELMKAHFNVEIPDYLIGRSQYLGRMTVDISINPIVQMSETTSESAQGNMTAVGIGQDQKTIVQYSAIEHGMIMILATAKSQTAYYQGIDRKWSKSGKWDYMFPEFYNLGDQSTLNKEIYLTQDSKTNNEVFGYQERYREYREGKNELTGLMRPDAPTNLAVYHLAEKFAELPKLNKEFIKSKTPIDRSLAIPSEPALILDIWFNISATRSLTLSSRPSIISGNIS